jgi:hypothetical protein
MLVCALIEDEFAAISRKRAQLEPSSFAPEERIILGNLNWACVRYGGCFRYGLDAFDARFDFDVPVHLCLAINVAVQW